MLLSPSHGWIIRPSLASLFKEHSASDRPVGRKCSVRNGPPQFVPLCLCGVHALTRTVCAHSPTRVAALRERASSLFVTTSKRLLFGPQVALADSKFFFLIAFVRSILTARDLSFMLKFFHPFLVSSCHTAINEVTGLVNT